MFRVVFYTVAFSQISIRQHSIAYATTAEAVLMLFEMRPTNNVVSSMDEMHPTNKVGSSMVFVLLTNVFFFFSCMQYKEQECMYVCSVRRYAMLRVTRLI